MFNLLQIIKWNIRFFVKKLLLFIVNFVVSIIFYKKYKFKHKEVKNIGILFTKNLGIGDLVMLSPGIEKIAKIFRKSNIDLITWIPEVITFSDNVNWVSEAKGLQKKYDLIISPTLNLLHLKFIFKAKYYIGYFSNFSLKANFKYKKQTYNERTDHYLNRIDAIIFSLKKNKHKKITKDKYNNLKDNQNKIFTQYNLSNNYVVFGAFSKWIDRQWNLDDIVKTIDYLITTKGVKEVVFIGLSDDISITKMEYVLKHVKEPQKITSLLGKTSLQDINDLCKKSKLFIGVDSGPSHLAYLSATKVITIFITVKPALRLPKIDLKNIKAIYPFPAPKQSLFDGLGPVRNDISQKYINNIRYSDIVIAIDSLINN